MTMLQCRATMPLWVDHSPSIPDTLFFGNRIRFSIGSCPNAASGTRMVRVSVLKEAPRDEPGSHYAKPADDGR
jgi:hypothetical protein